MFEILLNGKTVGQADVQKEGLYYLFSCTCNPPTGDIHRILVRDNSNERCLGICVPSGDHFILSARVPAKYLQLEEMQFSLIPNRQTMFSAPVSNNKEFPYLDKLETARLQDADGLQSIIITQSPDQQGSDQSQEFRDE